MKPMKQVAQQQVKVHEKKLHGMKCGGQVKKYAKGGSVRGTGCATKGTKFSGTY